MSVSALEGRRYGPFRVRASADRVADFVQATGDDPVRWTDHAPPGFAAVPLFAAAPAFFDEPEVASHPGVVHLDQTFEWTQPVPIEGELAVEGVVRSIRHRGNLFFVTFDTAVAGPDGGSRIESSSTFLVSEDRVVRERHPEEEEPDWDRKEADERPGRAELPPPGGALAPLRKSASRADLVRYAGTTRDWNPIHWDHAAAVAAGFPGIICHGLLMVAWIAQAAGRYDPESLVLGKLRVKFRRPLRPGRAAEVAGTVASVVDGSAALALTVRSGDEELAGADVHLTRR